MKIICSIETLCELIAKDMPKRGKAIGITLFTLDLYQGDKLSRGGNGKCATARKACSRISQGKRTNAYLKKNPSNNL